MGKKHIFSASLAKRRVLKLCKYTNFKDFKKITGNFLDFIVEC